MVRQKGSMLGAFSRAESEIFKLVEKQILSGKHRPGLLQLVKILHYYYNLTGKS
jgi:hypothetical protein